VYQRLEEFLAAHLAKFEVLTHAAAVTAQEQAEVTHTPGTRMAKVVIVKERDGLVLAVLPAAWVLDLDRLKGLIGHGDLRLATVEEIAAGIPDCAPGAIPPFGELWRLRTWADATLLGAGDMTMPAGDFQTAIRMGTAEYRRLARPRVGDVAFPEALGLPRPRVSAAKPWRRPAS
jgi:Ala-tRNA(Pro) deacylase